MNLLYNSTDAQILLTSNEGWGLSLTEAMLAGSPIIANVTGGMQDQMRFSDEYGRWFTPDDRIPSNHTGAYKDCGPWAFPVFPTSRSIQGSPQTPYIWDDRCNPEDAAKCLREFYDVGREERKRLGSIGTKFFRENQMTATAMADNFIKSMNTAFDNWKPRERYNMVSI